MVQWEQRQADYDEVVEVFGSYDNDAAHRSASVELVHAGGGSQEDKLRANIRALQALQARIQAEPPSAPSTGSVSIVIRDPSASAARNAATPISYSQGSTSDVGGLQALDSQAASQDGSYDLAESQRFANYPPVSFEETTNRSIVAGTHNSFSEIGNALSSGRLGDAWRYATFEASPEAKAVANARAFPQPTADAQRLSTMFASPAGSIAWGAARLAGADQQAQDALLITIAAAGQVVGAATGTFKQTLTARAPSAEVLSSVPRSLTPSIGRARYMFDASIGRYREIETGQFVAAKNLPWPSNAGFTSSSRQTVAVDTILDRYGSLSGRFLGEPGATVSQRGMAPGSQEMPYTRLRVARSFDAQVGPAAAVPEFGAVGGATQYLPGRTTQQLIDQGFLEVLK